MMTDVVEMTYIETVATLSTCQPPNKGAIKWIKLTKILQEDTRLKFLLKSANSVSIVLLFHEHTSSAGCLGLPSYADCSNLPSFVDFSEHFHFIAPWGILHKIYF